MDKMFITELNIREVRHLANIKIPLSKDKRKNLVLTGKNGSGKTSVLNCLANYLDYKASLDFRDDEQYKVIFEGKQQEEILLEISRLDAGVYGENFKRRMLTYLKYFENWGKGCRIECTPISAKELSQKYKRGEQNTTGFFGERKAEKRKLQRRGCSYAVVRGFS